MDAPLLLILVLLAAAFVAWATGLFVYPFGLLVLLGIMVTRLIQLYSKNKN